MYNNYLASIKLVLFYLVSFLITSCGNKECSNDNFIPGRGYVFQVPVSVTPALDTFRVGQTFTYSSVFSKDVYELSTQRNYNLNGFLFYPEVSISTVSNQYLTPALDSFNYVILSGDVSPFTYSDGGKVIIGQYSESTLGYELEIQFTAFKTGLYTVCNYLPVDILDINQDFNGKICNNQQVDADSYLEEGIDDNYDSFISIGEPIVSQHYKSEYEQAGCYTFVVVP